MPRISQIIIGQPDASLVDPHLWVDSRATLSMRFSMYESLVKYDRQGKVIPGLASSWHVSPDARTWTFQLHPGVRFHDGALLTAADAAYALKRAARRDMPGQYGTAALLASYLEKMQVDTLDETHLRITLAEPMADLLDLLIYAVIIQAGPENRDWARVPGTGPFRLAEECENEVHLTRFSGYHAKPAPAESLVFRGIPAEAGRIRAFLNREVDRITYMPIRCRSLFEGCEFAHILERSSSLCVILLLNAFQGPCADKRVRQALNYATDVDALIDALYAGSATRLNGPLSRHHTGIDANLPPYPHNPDIARRLLEEAGYADGITLTLDRPVTSPDESEQLAALLRQQWQAAGICLQERIHTDREAYSLRVRAKQIADMCVFDSSPMSTYRVLREKLHSGFAGPWWEGYHNPDVNQLMERAWATTAEPARVDLYRQAYRLIQADAPWLFLYSPLDMEVVNREGMGQLEGWFYSERTMFLDALS